MSPHVVDVAQSDLGLAGPVEGLAAVPGGQASLLVQTRVPQSAHRSARVTIELVGMLYAAAKIAPRCVFSRLAFEVNPDVPAGMMRVVLLPAGES